MAAQQRQPIEVHYWPTPNGYKVTIMLEELGVPYEVKYIHIGRGEQFEPNFLVISPNNRMPAIVDPDGPGGEPISVFESGAILMYLGRKFGRFYPRDDERRRVEVEEWLVWQVANIGPMLGQNHHFRNYAPEKLAYAIRRYEDEAHRLYGILDKRLGSRDFVAGDYSIADIAILPWTRNYERQGVDIAEFPHARRWLERLLARPAVERGLQIGAEKRMDLAKDKAAQKVLFNQRARV